MKSLKRVFIGLCISTGVDAVNILEYFLYSEIFNFSCMMCDYFSHTHIWHVCILGVS